MITGAFITIENDTPIRIDTNSFGNAVLSLGRYSQASISIPPAKIPELITILQSAAPEHIGKAPEKTTAEMIEEAMQRHGHITGGAHEER